MTAANLNGIADLVVRRAQRQGYVAPSDVREELTQAGASADLWQDVVALARRSLTFRHGRYYYSDPVSERVRREQAQQLGVQQAVDQLLGFGRPAATIPIERRVQDRVNFVQTVTVRTEDGDAFTLLSRDLSVTGIRLIGAGGSSAKRSASSSRIPAAGHPTISWCASSGPAPSATACTKTAGHSSK